jgi:hypothetical protein
MMMSKRIRLEVEKEDSPEEDSLNIEDSKPKESNIDDTNVVEDVTIEEVQANDTNLTPTEVGSQSIKETPFCLPVILVVGIRSSCQCTT